MLTTKVRLLAQGGLMRFSEGSLTGHDLVQQLLACSLLIFCLLYQYLLIHQYQKPLIQAWRGTSIGG